MDFVEVLIFFIDFTVIYLKELKSGIVQLFFYSGIAWCVVMHPCFAAVKM